MSIDIHFCFWKRHVTLWIWSWTSNEICQTYTLIISAAKKVLCLVWCVTRVYVYKVNNIDIVRIHKKISIVRKFCRQKLRADFHHNDPRGAPRASYLLGGCSALARKVTHNPRSIITSRWSFLSCRAQVRCQNQMHNIIQIHNSVMWDWKYFADYLPHSVWM